MTRFTGEERSVVVGVDGSASALHAVRWAAREAVRYAAPLRLVHVCHLVPVRHPRRIAPPAEYRNGILDQGRLWLRKAEHAARLVSPDLRVITDLRDGIAAELLVEESRTARLIVVGSRGLGGFASMLVGSVAIAVSTHAWCPVVVMDSATEDGLPAIDAPVLVGVDGSELSDAAVEFGFRAAVLRGVPLIALHTWLDVTMAGAWATLPRSVDWGGMQVREETALAERIAPWRARFPTVTVHEVVERDRPEHALLRHGERAQLIVVGSRGRGALGGLGRGSVSQTLLHRAGCPVVIARTAARHATLAS